MVISMNQQKTEPMKLIKKITVATAIIMAGYMSNVSAQAKDDEITFSNLYNAIKSEVDPVAMEVMLLKMQKQAGNAPNAGILLDASRSITADAYAQAKNAEKAKYWMSQIEAKDWRANVELSVSRTLIDVGLLKEAEEIVKPLADQPGPGGFQYGLILYKRKEYQNALKYLATGTKGRGLHGADAEYYTLALAASGKQNEAFEEANKQLSNSVNRTDEFKTVAKKLFVKKYGNEQRYKTLTDSVENAEHEKMLAKIAKMEVNQPAPDFELKDLNGKSVSLKSLRGKTVILDFWATWCQPCVASFPGMQKAVNYYKNDDSVVFMFIHTQDKSPDPIADASKMIKAKKHNFDVYMDLSDKVSKKSPVAAAYKITGIPAKFFIDKNGIIRYRNTGYIGLDEAIPEIKTIVDQLKKS